MANQRIIIDGKDVTEHVARMYDAIVHSLDWGSGYLDTEDIESILIIAKLAGWDVPEPNAPVSTHADALKTWRAQVQAKADAETEDRSDD